MKIRAYLTACILMMAAAPSAWPVPIQFFTNMSGAAEEPPNDSQGTGAAFVTIDPVAHTLGVNVTFSGLVGTTTNAHIHVINGPGDLNTGDTVGPVATTAPTFPGFPAGVTAGTYVNIFDTTMASTFRDGFITDSGGTVAMAEAALFQAIQEGRAYFNIHTSFRSGGEIRGFLQRVPEPGVLSLFVLGLAGLAAARSGS